MDLLNPTTDLVFKLLLQRDKKLVLLRSMLECVLEPTSSITELEILNPELEKDYPVDKSIALDVRAKLKDLTRIDVEMQAEVRARSASRFLYYWSREFGQGMQRGDEYHLLAPVTTIIWLAENLLKAKQFHGVFHLSEDTTRERFSDNIEIHTLELRKLRLLAATKHPRLHRWARFFLARSKREFESLAKEDPTMDTAKKTLEDLSADKNVRKRAYARETALRGHLHTIAAERAAGRNEGRAEGQVEGQALSILEVFKARRLAVSAEQRKKILSCQDHRQLSTWLRRAVTIASVKELFTH